MLASITPLGERGRQATWGVTVGAFAIGSALAGAALGALAGALGGMSVPGSFGAHARLAALAVAAVAAIALDVRGDSVPGPRRQVDERWLDEFRGWVYGLGFGAQLGAGVVTIVSSASTYLALLAAVLSGSLARGAAILGSFGFVRGLGPLVAARVRTPGQLVALHSWLLRHRSRARILGIAAMAAILALAAVWAAS
jgi:hypothetical protein